MFNVIRNGFVIITRHVKKFNAQDESLYILKASFHFVTSNVSYTLSEIRKKESNDINVFEIRLSSILFHFVCR